MSRRKGFTLIELLVVVAIIALLISILLPSLARAREITKRAVCASNLRGIGQACKVYSNDNFDWFPASPFAELTTTGGTPGQMSVEYPEQMSRLLYTQLATDDRTFVHPSRSLFLLVIDGSCTTRQFICPSSGDTEDDLRNRGGSTEVAAQLGFNRFDFRGYPFESYGYQLPFGPKAKPNENLDPRMALLADKGPYYQAGAIDENSADRPAPDDTVDSANQSPCSFSGPGQWISTGQATESDILKMDTEKWKIFNSRNHAGEGENVLFVDGHVDFVKKPIVGVNYDNIYTQQADYTLKGCLEGLQPIGMEGPYSMTDSLIVP